MFCSSESKNRDSSRDSCMTAPLVREQENTGKGSNKLGYENFDRASSISQPCYNYSCSRSVAVVTYVANAWVWLACITAALSCKLSQPTTGASCYSPRLLQRPLSLPIILMPRRRFKLGEQYHSHSASSPTILSSSYIYQIRIIKHINSEVM